MRVPPAIVLIMAFATGCGPREAAGPTPSVVAITSGSPEASTPSAAPVASTPTVAATPTPTPTPRTVPFPDVRLIAATSAGEVRIYSAGKWDLEAKICPEAQPFSSAIQALEVSANGRTIVVQCSQQVGGGADPDARNAFVYDLVTKEKRAVTGTSAFGLGPVSPDGRELVIATLGDCPMPAPVCQSRRYLLDLATGAKRELLPSDYWLSTEFRWTALGLSYFRPVCAEAGCVAAAKAGTYLWSRSAGTWTRISPRRLIASNGVDRHIFEERSSLNDQTSVSIVEVVGGKERVLTPTSTSQELALSLLADGRTVAWRPDGPFSFDGEIVVYRDGQDIRHTRGRFSGYLNAASGSWIVAAELSGAPSWKIHAYSIDQDAFATLIPTIAFTQFRVVPSP